MYENAESDHCQLDRIPYTGPMPTAQGVLVLDSHRTSFDILFTARWIRHTYHPQRILMPIAGYVFHVPIMNLLIRLFAWYYQIEFHPVYQKIELHPPRRDLRFFCSFYPHSLTSALREQRNQEYVKASLQAVREPGTVVIVSPYGGPNEFGKTIKYGVRQLIKTSTRIIVTESKLSWSKADYQTRQALFPVKVTNKEMALQNMYQQLSR